MVDQPQALALLAVNEGNIAATARKLDITPYKLRRIRDANPDLYREVQKQVMEDVLDTTLLTAQACLDEVYRRVTEGDELKDLKTKELMVTGAIAIDKVNVMTSVQSKFSGAQQTAGGYSDLTEEELIQVIDAEYREISNEAATDEDLPDTSKDGLPDRPKRVSPIGAALHRGGSPE